MSYDVVFVASCQLDAAQLPAWKKTKVDPRKWSDWKGSFGNAPDEAPTVAALLARWRAWGVDEEPWFIECKLVDGELTLQGFLAEDSYHEVASVLGAFFRSAERFGGAGDLYIFVAGVTYRLSLVDGASRFKVVTGKPPANILKKASAVEMEAARRVGEDFAAPAPARPAAKKVSLTSDPPAPPGQLGDELDRLNEARKFKAVEAYAKRYFAAGLPGLDPEGAHALLACWFRQQKGTGVEPLLAAILKKTEAAMKAKKPKHPWLTEYALNDSLLWVLGFAGQADRGIVWFERLRALECFVSVNTLDAYVFLLYTSKTATRAVRERAIVDMVRELKAFPHVPRSIKWAWHNLAALAAVLADADRVAEFVAEAKDVGYDLAELRKEPLLAPFRADPRVKAVLG